MTYEEFDVLAGAVLAAALANAPVPISGDFDHDGRPDVAQIIRWKPGVYHLVIRRGAPGHPVSVIDTIKENDLFDLFLTREKPGRLRTWCGKGGDTGDVPCMRRSVRLRGDTLAFGTKESSEAVAIWTGRKFEVVWISD